jgi:hypothetical protein
MTYIGGESRVETANGGVERDDEEDFGGDLVQAALSALGRLDGRPVSEHVDAFEMILSRLEAALTSVDEPARGAGT